MNKIRKAFRYDLLVNRATRYEAETTETIAELRIPGGTIYTLPSGRKVLITDADFQQIACLVGWDVVWRVVVAVLAVLVALALSGCRLGTPNFKPPRPPATTSRAAPLIAPTPSVILAWDSAGGTGALTYSVHSGFNPGGMNHSYANVVTGLQGKTYTMTGLIPGARYYFAATAVDSLGIASEYSNEAVYTVPADGGGTAVIVLNTGPTVQGPWTAILTNSIPATNVQEFFNQEIRLTK